MELLGLDTFNNKNFELLKKEIVNKCIDNRNSLSYEEFKKRIIIFIEGVMSNYIERSNIKEKSNYSLDITPDLPINVRGYYNHKEPKLVINEDVIKNIYNGNILDMLCILHELNHFKIHMDLSKGEISYDLILILKENLLRAAIIEDEIRLNFNKGIPSQEYYMCNYSLYREENYVNIMAIADLNLFLENVGIELNIRQTKKIDKILSTCLKNYTNYNRDFTSVITYNDFNMNIEDAFEQEFDRHPEWLEEFPILQIEYYKNNEGKIIKRTVEELKEYIIEEKNIKKIECIIYIIRDRYENNKQKNENKKSEDTPKIKNNNIVEVSSKHK